MKSVITPERLKELTEVLMAECGFTIEVMKDMTPDKMYKMMYLTVMLHNLSNALERNLDIYELNTLNTKFTEFVKRLTEEAHAIVDVNKKATLN
jgi:adenine-specific DNA methylase